MTSRPKIQCTKFFFVLFNLIFWLTGLALLVIGIWSKISLVKYMRLSTSIDVNLAPYIMIGCGSFIILVGILGCWACLKEHSWALLLYMVILALLFIAELAAGIAGYVLRDKLKNGVERGMRKEMEKYGNDTDGSTKKVIDDTQGKAFFCCGANSYLDWSNGTLPNWKKNTVPQSCCKKKTGCHYNSVYGHENDFYTKGCVNAMQEFFKEKFAIIGGTALGIAFFQVLGIICSYLLARYIRVVSSYQEF